MDRRMWAKLTGLSLCLATTAIGAGCHGTKTPKAQGGNANWLQPCASDTECGDDACICGVCTIVCEDDDDCEGRDSDNPGRCTTRAADDEEFACSKAIAAMMRCVPSCDAGGCVDERLEGGTPNGTTWPPRAGDVSECECTAGEVCGTTGCEPACDSQGRCALWPTEGKLLSLKVSDTHVVWVTDSARDPAGSPLHGRRLWMATYPGGSPMVLLEGVDRLESLDGSRAVLQSDTLGHRSIELKAGAEPTDFVDIDGLWQGNVNNGVLYGLTTEQDDLTHVWSAPLDGSMAPVELIALAAPPGTPSGGSAGRVTATGDHLVLWWGTLYALRLDELEGAPVPLGYAEDYWLLGSHVFGNSDRREGSIWNLATGQGRRLFESEAVVGVSDPKLHRSWLYYQALDSMDNGEAAYTHIGVRRVPTTTYGEPQEVLDRAAVGPGKYTDLHYGVNDEGIFWHTADAPGYILHAVLDPPACRSDAVCGADSTCTSDGLCAY